MDDNIFEVGQSISIETHYKCFHTTHLIGWMEDLYLVTGVVQTSGKTGQLKVNDICGMRYLKDGIAYGFVTRVLAINFHPFPVMFIEYPKTIEQSMIRKHDRIQVNLPARFLDEAGRVVVDATMTDISESGCGLTIPAWADIKLVSENLYQIVFSAMESDLRLSCAISHRQTLKGTHILGLEFIDVPPEDKERFTLFLESCSSVLTSKTNTILSQMNKTFLGGYIKDVPVTDVLQIFHQLEKEGVIHVTAEKQKGFIAIKEGQVMAASLNGLQGEDALVDLLSLQEGEFHVSAKETPAGHMHQPINSVLIEVSRLIDERESLKDDLLGGQDTLILQTIPDTEDYEVQMVIDALLSGAMTVSDVQVITGLSMTRVGLISARMVKDGYLKKTS